MNAKIESETKDELTLKVTISRKGTMLEREAAIRSALNQAGSMATGRALADFDTDGRPLQMGDMRWYSKGKTPEVYQTPYGPAEVERHTYQTSKGGRGYCPMEQAARIVLTATPTFAKLLSHKYAEMGSTAVVRDLTLNHDRTIATSFLQKVVDAVATMAQLKEETWEYAPPELTETVKTLSVGLDGTMLLMVDGSYREVMVGTLACYNREGERLFTQYTAAPPEYGRATFLERLERDVNQLSAQFPKATKVGVADGAPGNWTFLEQHTTGQVVDFYHAAEYLGGASEAHFGKNVKGRNDWLDDACHRLKHNHGAAAELTGELQKWAEGLDAKEDEEEPRVAGARFFKNQQHRMDYAAYRKKGWPIGSGVTEAACKTIVKTRMRGSGMKFKERGAGVILTLRTLLYSTDRWAQFWSKVDQFGFEYEA